MISRYALLLAVAAASFALASCVTPAQRVDALSEINVISKPSAPTPAAYTNLNAALILSPDSKAAIAYLEHFNAHLFRSNYWASAKVDIAKVFTIETDMLAHHFKSVTKIDAVSQAKDADVVIVLDLYAKIAPPPGSRTTNIDVKLVFLSPDGTQLETVSAHSEAVIPRERTNTAINVAAEAARDKLEGPIVASPALSNLSHSKPGASVAAALPPALPPAPAPAAASGPRSSSVDRPGYRLAEKTHDFAIVVGIEKYMGLPDAQFAQRDAEAVRSHLLALGYPERNIALLTGQGASGSGIKKYVETWLPNNISDDSTVFFYYSGHGAPDVKSGAAYLVPSDGDPQYLEDTAYPIQRLYQKLGALKAKQVIVAMDSCFSGAGGRSVLAKGLRPLVAKIDMGDISSGKMISFSAASGEQVSGTDEDQGHGLFTYHFLNALNERGGNATAKGLYDALKSKVQDQARRANREQVPQLQGGAGSDAALR